MWVEKEDRLCKTFVFQNFVDVISFLVLVAFEAEKINHHPEWSNVYNRLSVELTTHDKGGITHLDRELSSTMDEIFSRFQV